MLSVGGRVADRVLVADHWVSSGLLLDETADALNPASASQAADGRLGDALDVVAQHLAVPLGAALSESLSA